jgi:hypothetical protein
LAKERKERGEVREKEKKGEERREYHWCVGFHIDLQVCLALDLKIPHSFCCQSHKKDREHTYKGNIS